MIDRSETERTSTKVESEPLNDSELSKSKENRKDGEETLDNSFSMESSDDGLDQFKLRISDDDINNKDGDLESQEETPGMENNKMEVDESSTKDTTSEKNAEDEKCLKENCDESVIVNGDENVEETLQEKVNGVSEADSEENAQETEVKDTVNESAEPEDETVTEDQQKNEAAEDCDEEQKARDEQKNEAAEESVEENKKISEKPDEERMEEEKDEEVVKEQKDDDHTEEQKEEEKPAEEQKVEDSPMEETPLNDVAEDAPTALSPNSGGQNSGPASVSVRSVSMDSEGAPASMTSTDDPRAVEQIDEESQQSSNSANFAADVAAAVSSSRKRPRALDPDDTTSTGAKRVRVDKRHCSDGEQEPDSSAATKKERKSSLSESDLVKDIESYNFRQIASKVSNLLKGDKWKPAELTDEEKKRLEQSNAREKKMRENVLRVIQRNYKNMSVEDFEDAIYVAVMDYFCHYNSSTTLQRKVLMLEKLVSKVQENYNRTFKQFCEAKYLLRRMVEIRKEEAKKCVCKDKLPFKLIRSVAVQVQTARCRGGDLCPGAGIGLDPKFKASGGPGSKTSTPKKSGPEQNQSSSNNTDDISVAGTSKESSSGTVRSISDSQGRSSPPPIPPMDRPIERPRHISVSVPPPPVPVTRWTAVAKSSVTKSPTVRPRPSSELQSNAKPSPLSLPATPNHQRSTRSSPAQPPVATPSPSATISVPPPRPPPAVKQNQSIVIDLTDKDEEQVVPGPVRSAAPSPSKAPPVQVITTPQPTTTRVVKTSVLSPMPQLPPLPAAPLYKSMVKRPPQPVLKVCKADQSGIMLSWTLRTNIPLANEISLYQVYACQENAGVTREWSTVGDVKALPLPMACTLSQFREGHRYHFVVRAVDKFKVMGEFSHPASILLVSKNGTSNHAIAAASATNNTRR